MKKSQNKLFNVASARLSESKGKDGKYYVYFVVELKEEPKTADEIKVKRNEIVGSDTTDIGLDIDDYL